MALKFAKQINLSTNPDLTQEELDAAIVRGQYAAGTTLDDIILNSDLNAGVVAGEQVLTDGATINWDASLGTIAAVTLGGNRTVAAPVNAISGDKLGLYITQDDTGSRTLTWDTLFRFNAMTAPTLTTTAKYSDYLEFLYNGTYFIELLKTQGLKLYEDPPPPPSAIHAIYPIEIVMAAPTEVQTQTITEVNLANTMLIPTGYHCFSDQALQVHCTLKMTSSTTVQASRNNSGGAASQTLTVRGLVVEFTDGVILSKQEKTVAAESGTSTNAAITAVDTARACVVFQGHRYDDSGGAFGSNVGAVLVDATTVRIWREGAATTANCELTVYEFSADYVQSVQSFATQITGSNTADTITISSVDPDNSMLIYNGISSGSGGQWRHLATRLEITDATTVTARRNVATSNNRRPCFAVIEWVDGVLNSKQAGTVALNTVTSGTTTITEVNTDKTVMVYGGFSTTNDQNEQLVLLPSIKLSNSTTVQANRGGDPNNVTVNYQAIEFI